MSQQTKLYRLDETGLGLALFQAVNCQPTFIKSLRDKITGPLGSPIASFRHVSLLTSHQSLLTSCRDSA